MSDTPLADLEALLAAGGERIVTHGPNSGGVEGYVVSDDAVRAWQSDWEGTRLDVPIALNEFLRRYASREDLRDVLAAVRRRLGARSDG